MATHSFSALTLFTVGFILTIDVSFRDRKFFVQGKVRHLTEKTMEEHFKPSTRTKLVGHNSSISDEVFEILSFNSLINWNDCV